MTPNDRPLVWLHGKVKSPPFSPEARREVGILLRLIQEGESLAMPHARAMPGVGPRCRELRINDHGRAWRIILRIDPHAILILDVFLKKTANTPWRVIAMCRERARRYDAE